MIMCNEAKTAARCIESTAFWKTLQANRIGNLLEAARLKAGLTQKEVANLMQIKQNMVSDFENGRRRLTKRMAERFAKVLHIKPERLIKR